MNLDTACTYRLQDEMQLGIGRGHEELGLAKRVARVSNFTPRALFLFPLA